MDSYHKLMYGGMNTFFAARVRMKVQKSLLHISDTRIRCTFKPRLFVYIVLMFPANECKMVVFL